MYSIGHIQHNTYRIKSADRDACAMFHCDEGWLVGQELPDLIPDESMKGLAKLRLSHIRNVGGLHEQPLPLMRPSGAIFWADVQTNDLGDGLYESTLEYKGEF